MERMRGRLDRDHRIGGVVCGQILRASGRVGGRLSVTSRGRRWSVGIVERTREARA